VELSSPRRKRPLPARSTQPASTPDLSVVIVNYNVRELLAACLDSVHRQQMTHTMDVWVVDNASHDGSAEMVRERFPSVHLIANEQNLGFATASNQAIQASKGRFILVLNPDTRILSGSLDRMIDYFAQHADVGMVGVRLVYPDGSFQHSCFRFPGLAQAFLDVFPLHPRLLNSPINGRYRRRAYAGEMDVDCCLGACFMLRRDTGLQFDDSYFMYVEEIDLAWRLKRAGWKIRYIPELTVLHHAGASTRQRSAEMKAQLLRSRRLFNRRYRGPRFTLAWEAIVRLGQKLEGRAARQRLGGPAPQRGLGGRVDTP
jgi:N-acetylglucosaminyl-diphospho-decaprenol L-rhamnosyltransferase